MRWIVCSARCNEMNGSREMGSTGAGMKGTELTLPSETEVVLRRELNGRRELVWRAWTDPGLLGKWWGPTGFTTTTESIELRAGGRWRFMMHGPDGTDYPNLIEFLEFSRPERIVYRHVTEDGSEPPHHETVVTFEPSGDTGERTVVAMRTNFASREMRDMVLRDYNAGEGGKQTLRRLAAMVESMGEEGAAEGPSFTICRVFDAPREMVWSAWTRRELLEKWFGPAGASVSRATLDLRAGGMFHYFMSGEDGRGHWVRWVFREVSAPERLVFVVSFSDERAGVTRAFFDEDWPREVLSTVTIDPHAGIGGGTVVMVRWEPLNATEVERAAFERAIEGARGGWSGTLDELAAFLRGGGAAV